MLEGKGGGVKVCEMEGRHGRTEDGRPFGSLFPQKSARCHRRGCQNLVNTRTTPDPSLRDSDAMLWEGRSRKKSPRNRSREMEEKG